MVDIKKYQQEVYKNLIHIPNHWLDEIIFQIFELYIHEGDYVVEVGANIGMHTAILQKKVGEDGVVFAFEPFDTNINKLRLNLDLSKNNVKIYQLAVSNFKGQSDFKVFRDNPGICGFIERPWYDKNKMETITVEVDYIDNIKEIQDIKLIKIDAEGADFDVIRGSVKLINTCRPLIIFEGGRKKSNPASLYGYTKEEFKTFFEDNHYVLYDNLGIKFDFTLWDEIALNDFIAIPKEKHDELLQIIQLSVFSILYNKFNIL